MAKVVDEQEKIYDGDAVREGAGPNDNLVVLIWSMSLAVVIGVVLVSSFILSPHPWMPELDAIGRTFQ